MVVVQVPAAWMVASPLQVLAARERARSRPPTRTCVLREHRGGWRIAALLTAGLDQPRRQPCALSKGP
jgi:hypothetical protein